VVAMNKRGRWPDPANRKCSWP